MGDSFPAILSFASSEDKYDNAEVQSIYARLNCTRSEEEEKRILDMRRYNDYKWKLILLLGSYAGKDSPTGNYILRHTQEEIEALETIDSVKMTYLDCFDVPRIETEPKRIGISPFNRLCSESYTGYEKEIPHSSVRPTTSIRIKPCCEAYNNPKWLSRFSNYAWRARYVIIFLTSGWIDSTWTFLELLLYKELIKKQPDKNFIIVTGLDDLEGDYLKMIFDFMTITNVSVIGLEKVNLIKDYKNILTYIKDRRPLETGDIPSDIIEIVDQGYRECLLRMNELGIPDFISLRLYKCLGIRLVGAPAPSKRQWFPTLFGGYKKSKRKSKRKYKKSKRKSKRKYKKSKRKSKRK